MEIVELGVDFLDDSKSKEAALFLSVLCYFLLSFQNKLILSLSNLNFLHFIYQY